MEEIFQNPESILALLATIFGGSTGVAAFITSIVMGIKNKRYAAIVASSSSKDSQIEELKDMVGDCMKVVGLMMSAFTTQQLSSMALSADTKRQVVEIASKVEKLTDIKLDSTVEKALSIMTTADPSIINEQKQKEIIEAASKAQTVLDVVNEQAESIVTNLNI